MYIISLSLLTQDFDEWFFWEFYSLSFFFNYYCLTEKL